MESTLPSQARMAPLVPESLLAAVVESSGDAIVSKSLEGIILSWNPAAERLFGYSALEAIGQHIFLIIPPARRAEEDRIISRIRSGQRVEHFETVRLRKDGSPVEVSLTISPVKDERGGIIGASKIARDISARRRHEAERERFVALIESSADFIGICELDGTPSFVNRSGLSMIGLDNLQQMRGRTIWDLFFPEDLPRVREVFIPLVLRRGQGEMEVRFRHFRTGGALWMAFKVSVLRDASGQATSFATVSQNVTERRRMADELHAAAERLAEADRRKNEFLATLAHELRNPLAPMASTMELIRRANGDAAILVQSRQTLERQLRHLRRLVDDLTDFNRIALNRLELCESDVDLGVVLMQAVESVRQQIESARQTLRLSLPDRPVMMRADPTRLGQVFGNLLNNATKYTPAGGVIEVGARVLGDAAEVRIADSGIGIPPDKLQQIFEMFMQIDQSAVRSRGGLGIGLSLVKHLVERHRGSIEARSDGEGLGSEFIVRLPVTGQSTAAADEKAGSNEIVPGLRVLIVDDNPDAASSLAELLRLWGSEVLLAHDGHSAVQAAELHRPEVGLIDISLPGMDGYAVCRSIRATSWGRDIPLFALTGWDQEADRQRSLQAGFDAHLVKPVEPDRLREVLLGLLD